MILSAWGGFFGLISKKTRLITIDWDKEGSFIKMKVVLDADASKDVIEDMDVAYTDIIADFHFNKIYPLECILSNEDISSFKEYKLLYYVRSEDNWGHE